MSEAQQALTPDEEKALAPAKATEVSVEMLRYKEELAAKMGLPSPYGMSLLKQVCADLAASGMVPDHWQSRPAAMFMAAMRGREMGFSPVESIMEVFWLSPKGRLGFYTNKLLQKMHQGGVKTKVIEHTSERCEVLFTPPGDHEPVTISFDIAEAKAAGLVKPDSNWLKWAKDMVWARVIGRGWRALVGTFDGSTATAYTKEEVEDIESDDALDQLSEKEKMKAQGHNYFVDVKPAEKPTETKPEEKPEEKPDPKAETKPEEKPAESPKAQRKPKAEKPPVPQPEEKPLPSGFFLGRMQDGHMNRYDMDGFGALDTATQKAREMAKAAQHKVFVLAPDGSVVVELDPEPPEPKPEQKEKPAHLKSLAELSEKFAAMPQANGVSQKTIAARMTTWLAEYFGIPNVREVLAQPADVWPQALEDLGNVPVNEILSEPAESGKRARAVIVGYNPLMKKLRWDGKALGELAVAAAKKWGFDPEDFEKFIENNELDFVEEKDSLAFFRLFFHTRKAGTWRREVVGAKVSMAVLLTEMENKFFKADLSTVSDQKLVEEALEWSLKEIRAAKRNPPPPPAQQAKTNRNDSEDFAAPPPPAEKKEDDGELFDFME